MAARVSNYLKCNVVAEDRGRQAPSGQWSLGAQRVHRSGSSAVFLIKTHIHRIARNRIQLWRAYSSDWQWTFEWSSSARTNKQDMYFLCQLFSVSSVHRYRQRPTRRVHTHFMHQSFFLSSLPPPNTTTTTEH